MTSQSVLLEYKKLAVCKNSWQKAVCSWQKSIGKNQKNAN
jgi:hypothetical protein